MPIDIQSTVSTSRKPTLQIELGDGITRQTLNESDVEAADYRLSSVVGQQFRKRHSYDLGYRRAGEEYRVVDVLQRADLVRHNVVNEADEFEPIRREVDDGDCSKQACEQ